MIRRNLYFLFSLAFLVCQVSSETNQSPYTNLDSGNYPPNTEPIGINQHPYGSLRPILDCISVDDKEGISVAYFGFENLNDSIIIVPIGGENKFIPDPISRSQTTEFITNTYPWPFSSFSASYQSNTKLTWRLNGYEVVADNNSHVCNPDKVGIEVIGIGPDPSDAILAEIKNIISLTLRIKSDAIIVRSLWNKESRIYNITISFLPSEAGQPIDVVRNVFRSSEMSYRLYNNFTGLGLVNGLTIRPPRSGFEVYGVPVKNYQLEQPLYIEGSDNAPAEGYEISNEPNNKFNQSDSPETNSVTPSEAHTLKASMGLALIMSISIYLAMN